MTIENTDPDCYWLTNAMETLLMKIWHPITVATNSFTAKVAIRNFLEKTGSSLDGLFFKLHDFGYRGVSSEESAIIGGAAHLVNFMGSDTVGAIRFLQHYYEGGMTAFSVPASEHSVATSYTEDGEEEYFLNMMTQYPTGIVSIVIDTYDTLRFVDTTSRKYKDLILNRDGVTVYRPDSGNPVQVNLKLINLLWKNIGGEYTDTGHRLLNSKVRILQGDGIDLNVLVDFLSTMETNGWAADNWVFGSGGGLLQKFDRDTQRFAIKASFGEKEVNGEIVEFSFSKNPKTDPSKKSKAGRLKLHRSGGAYMTLSSFDETPAAFHMYTDDLETVFLNGEIKRRQTIDEIRDRSNTFLDTVDISFLDVSTIKEVPTFN